MSAKPAEEQKTLLGYTLKERIGAGGYGEVWSAEAPGGLSKAVKLVYGYHDEKRAQTELKAMDRIKEVRHPFLLSLERIEIFEGQLVIVSELADNSLADLFEEYAAEGSSGIPRDELLQYIRDAAEGLDYLSEAHSLQHLDVKPENLLLVGGHVKVADFGLVKDLQIVSQSLMTGMTPAYAAPELFDGSPSRASDQYSLAIVYQEMLTTIRPFPGTTPAQLAAQHMHGRPNLRPLPKSDQPIIAKALSKDPTVRYPNCRAMVDELLNRKLNKKRAIRRTSQNRSKADTTNTNGVNGTQRDVTAVLSESVLPFQPIQIEALDPPDCDVEKAEFQPTLILSVGNSANRAAQKLKQRLAIRHGGMKDVPSVKLICFDSDRNDVTKLSMAEGSSALAHDEIVEIPLQKPEFYREKTSSHFGWLSRRWIYNVPRSLQTEGLRPLGRLVFADHFEKICDSIQRALKDITQAENVATTSENLGISPAENVKPRVFIISSISGGIGSGMTLDLAYTVKTLLGECGLPIDCVTGILLHSTNRRSREAGLSSANAFTFLTELRHFNDFGFPGDVSLGLPEFQDHPPLDHVYYLDLGLDLRQTAYEQELDKLAEYVYLNSFSKCSVFFNECRKLVEDSEHFSLRTFGLHTCGPSNQSIHEIGSLIARELIQKWNGSDVTPCEEELKLTKSWFDENELHFDGVSNNYSNQLQEMLGDEKLNEITGTVNQLYVSESATRAEEIRNYLDQELGCPSLRKDSGHKDPAICHEFDRYVSEYALVIGEHFSGKIFALMESEKLDLAAQLRMIGACESNLAKLKAKFDEQTNSCEQQLEQLFSLLKEMTREKSGGKAEKPEVIQNCVDSYFQFRIQEFVLRYSKAYCRAISSSISSTKTIVQKFCNQLDLVKQNFSEDDFNAAVKTGDVNMEGLMLNNVLEGLGELIDRAEMQVYHAMISQRGGYSGVLNETASWQNHLPRAIHDATQRVLSNAFKKISLDKIIAENNINVEQLKRWLNEKLNLAQPAVSQCGGAIRTMIGSPLHASTSILGPIVEDQFGIKAAQVNGTSGELVLCFEGEDVALANVAYHLLEQRPDASQLAKRIHTRNDVEWSTLEDLL